MSKKGRTTAGRITLFKGLFGLVDLGRTGFKIFLEKYVETLICKEITHPHLATVIRALIGAFYNCAGDRAVSEIMSSKRSNIYNLETLKLTKEPCCIVSNDKNSVQYRNYERLMKEFSSLEDPDKYDLSAAVAHIHNVTGYKFENPKVLMIAFTHKTMAKRKDNKIWDDYNMLEFLGDSFIKYCNCKRIIRMKDELVKNKEPGFSDIQRLKFIKSNAEKNHLFAFVCIHSGIYSYIRHQTKNQDDIDKYAELVKKRGDKIEIEEASKFYFKMLADIIESIIGAILIDSFSIEKTEKAWENLMLEYLKKYADNPPTPPKRAFNKYCQQYDFLKHVEKGDFNVEMYSVEALKQHYGVTSSSPIMKYDYIYRGKAIFRRYYMNAVKSKDKAAFNSLRRAFR